MFKERFDPQLIALRQEFKRQMVFLTAEELVHHCIYNTRGKRICERMMKSHAYTMKYNDFLEDMDLLEIYNYISTCITMKRQGDEVYLSNSDTKDTAAVSGRLAIMIGLTLEKILLFLNSQEYRSHLERIKLNESVPVPYKAKQRAIAL